MCGIGKCMVIMALCFAAAGCGPDLYRGVPSPQTLEAIDLQYYWQHQLKHDGGEKVQWLCLLDENLYCMTDSNRLTAINAATGVPKWTYQVAIPSDSVFFPPSHKSDMRLSRKIHGVAEIMGWDPLPKIDREKLKDVNIADILDREKAKSSQTIDAAILPVEPQPEPFDAVMINTVHDVVVLDRVTGTERRRIHFSFPANTAGCSDGRYYFAGATGGRYHAIALNEALHAWSLSTDDMILAPLTYYNSRLFVASTDHYLYSAEVARQGKRVWRQKLDGSVTGELFADARGCFVPCQDNRLYAFDSMAGTTLWDPFACVGPLSEGVQVGEDTLFQYADRDGLYAINVANGRQRWHTPSDLPCKVVAVGGGMVYVVHGQAHEIRIMDELIGKVQNTIALGGNVIFARNALRSAVYLATPDGRIFCIRLKRAGRLTEQMLRG